MRFGMFIAWNMVNFINYYIHDVGRCFWWVCVYRLHYKKYSSCCSCNGLSSLIASSIVFFLLKTTWLETIRGLWRSLVIWKKCSSTCGKHSNCSNTIGISITKSIDSIGIVGDSATVSVGSNMEFYLLIFYLNVILEFNILKLYRHYLIITILLIIVKQCWWCIFFFYFSSIFF